MARWTQTQGSERDPACLRAQIRQTWAVTRIPLILDCDPGVDDAIAIFLAFGAAEELDLMAITTVGGNVGWELTARNARLLRELCGREETPVYPGAAAPLVAPPLAAAHFHGESGLGDLPMFEPQAPLARGLAADAIIKLVNARPPGTVSLAVTGPMTNVALAFRRDPSIASRLKQVVIMGGARREGGNITASAEYNIYADPHAAREVLASGCAAVMLGLDVTHQVRVTAERMARFERLTGKVGRAAAQLLEFSRRVELENDGLEDAPLHDPCTIAYVLAPHLFETRPAMIEVECASPLTRGHTAVEFRRVDPERAVRWTVGVDAEAVFNLVLDRIGR